MDSTDQDQDGVVEDGSELPRRRARSLYGRRKGKALRSYHARLIQELLPQLVVDVARPIERPADLFSHHPEDLRLEIGFGGGERLAEEAQRYPERGYFGCEPFINGVAKILAEIQTRPLHNLRLYNGDALDLVRILPSSCLTEVYLFYPDPWPKRRHVQRRFVSDDSLRALARTMKPGALLRFATDIDDYAGWTLERVRRAQDFVWDAGEAADWTTPFPGWTETRYEAKARREGRDSSSYLTFRRV